MRSNLFNSVGLFFYIIFFLAFVGCNDKNDDPGPSGGSGTLQAGKIADTCRAGASGKAIVRFSSNDTLSFADVYSFCEVGPEREYIIGASNDTVSGVFFYFKGLPISGYFRMQNLFSFRSSEKVDQFYVIYQNIGTYYFSQSVSKPVEITFKDDKVTFKIPTQTYNRTQGAGPNTIRFSVEIELFMF
jgi:hypothetical protein